MCHTSSPDMVTSQFTVNISLLEYFEPLTNVIFGPGWWQQQQRLFWSQISINQHEIVKIISFVPTGYASSTICIHYGQQTIRVLLTASIRIIVASKLWHVILQIAIYSYILHWFNRLRKSRARNKLKIFFTCLIFSRWTGHNFLSLVSFCGGLETEKNIINGLGNKL